MIRNDCVRGGGQRGGVEIQRLENVSGSEKKGKKIHKKNEKDQFSVHMFLGLVGQRHKASRIVVRTCLDSGQGTGEKKNSELIGKINAD